MRGAHNVSRVCSKWVRIGASHQRLRGEVKDHFRGKLYDGCFQLSPIHDVAANVFDRFTDFGGIEHIRLCAWIEGIAADLGTQFCEPQRQPAAFEPSVPCQEYAESWPGAHHVFQGASPVVQSSSRRCLSRSVSMGCQKPRWKKACTCFFLVRLSIGSRSNIQVS